MSSPARRAAWLQVADDVEDVRRQPLDAWKVRRFPSRERVLGVIRAPHERPCRHVPEPQFATDPSILGENRRRYVLDHREVAAGRLQVLPDGQEVASGGAQIRHRVVHLCRRLAEPHHDARFGGHSGSQALGEAEHRERAAVARLRPNRLREPLDGLEIVVEDVRAGLQHRAERGLLALEIRGQDLHPRGRRRGPHRPDGGREVPRSAVGEVVARHRRDHHVAEPHPACRFGDPRRLVGIERPRTCRVDGAEAAAAGAAGSGDHEGGGGAREALADVRTTRLLADGGESELAKHAAERPRLAQNAAPLRRPGGKAGARWAGSHDNRRIRTAG